MDECLCLVHSFDQRSLESLAVIFFLFVLKNQRMCCFRWFSNENFFILCRFCFFPRRILCFLVDILRQFFVLCSCRRYLPTSSISSGKQHNSASYLVLILHCWPNIMISWFSVCLRSRDAAFWSAVPPTILSFLDSLRIMISEPFGDRLFALTIQIYIEVRRETWKF